MSSIRRTHNRFFAAAACIALASCGGGGSDSTTGPGPTATVGSMAVTVAGVPSGKTGSVTVTGPGSYSQVVTATSTLSSLTPGSYTVTPAHVTDVGLDYTAPAATVTVASGAQAATTVNYAILTLPRASANRADENSLAQVSHHVRAAE